jgi:peptide/nickel transport system permease protein
MDVPNQLQKPSSEHIFGLDELGRDIFARVLWGGRTTILISFFGLAIGLFLGIILGTASAYYGRLTDTLIMRLMDIIMSIPPLLLMIALATG